MAINRFYFYNGDSAGSLDEFLDKLKSIDKDCFLHHVNEEKNDFSNWINDCVGDNALAKRIRRLKDKDKIISVVDRVVNSPTKVRGKIIAKIKKEILNEQS